MHGFHRILITTAFNTDSNNNNNKKIKVSCAANQHIIMISEGSRDTEDWNNDAENSALVIIVKFCQIETFYFFIWIIFYNITILFFDQINADLVSIRDLFQKKIRLNVIVLSLYVHYYNLYYHIHFLKVKHLLLWHKGQKIVEAHPQLSLVCKLE